MATKKGKGKATPAKKVPEKKGKAKAPAKAERPAEKPPQPVEPEAEQATTMAQPEQPAQEEIGKPTGKAAEDKAERPASNQDPNGGGIMTSETRILACQCGSTRFDVKKRTRTAVALVCMKCGLRASVKGNVATVRVQQQEITYALSHTVVTPDDSPPDDSEDGDGESGESQGGLGDEYGTRRYRHFKNVLETVVDRAFEAVRVMNCSDEKFREQTWQGHALEFICADFLSGCSHDVLQIVDAMDAAEEDAERIATDDGKPAPNARKIRELRAKVRDKLAVESGLLPVEMLNADDRQLDLLEGGEGKDGEPEDEPDGDDDDGDGQVEKKSVVDGGRLLRAVSATLEAYYEEARDAGVEDDDLPEHVIRDGAVPSRDLVERWTKSGGYLLRILGDERTVGPDGKRAAICAWIAAEPPELALDFSIEYDDATDDILGDGSVEVVELLPPDYKKIEQWEKPHFADRRETL